MAVYTDRELLKQQERGQLGTTGAVDPLNEVNRAHEETFTFEVGSDNTIAEMGLACEKAFKVKGVRFTGATALAANGSNYISMLVQKRDGAGGAAVTVASTDTNTAGANVSLAAFVPAVLTLSATTANLLFAAGNVLTFKSTETGTPATPIGKVQVTVEYI